MNSKSLSSPIVLALIWSGALFGDDGSTESAPGGYRDGVSRSLLDKESPDQLVDLATTDVPSYKVYTLGGQPGLTPVTNALMEEIRMERRYLFNALMEVGGTPYIGEPWHCNFPHQFGGVNVSKLPALAGNSCQSWIRGARDDNGALVAIWTNEVAHQQAEAFYNEAA